MTFKADAAYHREWRAKRGARTGQPGRPRTAQCGSISAFRRHMEDGLRGDQIDQACRDTWNEYQRGQYAKAKARKASAPATPRRTKPANS